MEINQALSTKPYWFVYGVFSVPLLGAVVSSLAQSNWMGAFLWGMTLATVGAGVYVGYMRHKTEHLRLMADTDVLLQRLSNG